MLLSVRIHELLLLFIDEGFVERKDTGVIHRMQDPDFLQCGAYVDLGLEPQVDHF